MHVDRDLFLLLCLSAPSALLVFVYMGLTFFVLSRFILKRYEEDTNLAETEPLFEVVSILMDSKAIRVLTYSTHLFLVILTDKGIMKKRGHLKNTPIKEVLSHFSKRERTLTVITPTFGALGMALNIVFLILNRLWK